MFGRSTIDLSRRRVLVAFAVCLFALRALIPIGFMVSVGASHAAVTLCPDYAPLPSGAVAGHLHHHAHGVGAAGAASGDVQLSGAESHGICPFAAAGHLGWHGSNPTAVSALPRVQGQTPGAAAEVAIPRLLPSYARSPRGPPPLYLG